LMKLMEIGKQYFILRRAGHLAVLNEAIDRGANINAVMVNNRTPLYEAVHPGHEHIVRELIKRGAELDRPAVFGETGGCIALALAAAMGHTGIARLLLGAGARIDIANGSGATALMLAAFRNSPEIVSLLVAGGADTSLRDKQGANALDYALAAHAISVTRDILSKAGLHPTKPRKKVRGTGGSGGCTHVSWRTEE
jgi:ankyrin repeat protein